MQSYRVVIVAPPQNPHVAAFRELAIALVHALRELGYSCDIQLNTLAREHINIILGFHLLPVDGIPAGCRYILYQLEQLSDTEGILAARPELLQLLLHAEAVWDYSPENCLLLKNRGIIAHCIPPGYSDSCTTVPSREPTIDVLFYGSRNDRRSRVLEELHAQGVRVKALFGIYGDERDRWIQEARMVINIHYYEANLFESVRLSYLVNNGIPVLSESSRSYPWEMVPVKRVPYNQLVPTALSMIQDPEEIREYGAQCQHLFRQYYRFSDLLISSGVIPRK